MTKVRTYRIDIDENAQQGDAIVIGSNGGMTSQHLGTAASLDAGICAGNVPILDVNGELPASATPSSVMKKCVYDKCCINDDAFDYNNFYNTPEIPVVNDPTVTFTQGGVTVGSISLNQSGPTTIGLLAGGVEPGKGIDIDCNKVAVNYDGESINIDDNNHLLVVDYNTIKSGAEAGATAVQADDLATVAMTGNYCDLINKPEIPSAQIQSDWGQTNTNLPDYIKNKPTIGNATITLQKNGTDVDTFTLNQTANKCLNLTLDKCDVGLSNVDNTSDADKPVSDATQCALNCKQDNITDLNTIRCNACDGKAASETIANYGDIVSHNVCEFATAEQGGKADTAIQAEDLSAVATSGKYCDLSGTPSLSTVATSGCYSDLSGTPNLCTVATSGCYSDLSGTPSLCSVATSGCYSDLTGTPTIPTDNCQLANSCGFVTNAVNDLTNYYLKSETYQKCEVDNLIANFGGFEVVSVLPTTNIKTNVIYLKGPIGTGTDRYEEWIYYNNTWTLIGETSTDLSNYAKCCDVPTNNCQLSNGCGYITGINCSDVTTALGYTPYDNTNPNGYTTCTGTLVASDLNGYAQTCSLCTVATTGSYNDLTDKLTAGTGINITNGAINSNGMTILSYGSSTWADFETAYNNKMVVYARASSNSNPATGSQTRLAFMAYVNNAESPTEVEFQYYRSVSAHCDALQGDQVFVYKLTKTSGWSVTTRNAFSKIVAGSGLSSSYANCCLTLCLDKGVNDLTNYTLSSNLSTVATSGCYNDLSGLPTIPTDNCQLGNGCNYITKSVNNLDNYTPTTSLATVATSGAYCDLTGTPTLACVAYSGSYEDLTCKPNLGVYQTTANMVCTLANADDSHYPSAKTVADALSCAGAGDMLSSMYDPNGKCADAFDYTNFINTPLLCTVATSGKYCDLTGLPTIPAALSAGNGISITNNCINVNYDGSTIKKNDGNCLYADLTGYALSCDVIKCKSTVGSQTVCTTASGCTTAFGVKSNATSSYISLSNCSGWLANIGATNDKKPTWYNGTGHTLAYEECIPTDNCQLANGCGYTTCTGTVVASDLTPYAKTCDLATVATSGKYCDLVDAIDLSCKQDTLVLGTNLHYDGDGKLQVGDANNDLQGMRYVCTSYLKTSSGALNATPTAVAVLDANGWICKQTPSCFINKMGFKTVATSGCYCDLTGAPTLCTVATSGKYCDLTGTPTIPTDNCQLANSCGYTTCTGTLTDSSLKTVNGCCLIGSGDICIQGGVTSVNGCTGAVNVCEIPSGGSTGQVLQKTSSGCGWATISLNAGDMCYSDFNWTSKSGATVTLSLNSTITPSANFTVNKPSTIKEGQTYVLRVTNGSTAYTMTLGTGISNPWGVNLELTPSGIDQFVFLATSSSTLELQNDKDDEIRFVTQDQYNSLPATKATDGRVYFIVEAS